MNSFLRGMALSILILSACTPAPRQHSATGEQVFRTTAPSLLYFKNMKSTQYSVDEEPGTRIEVYRPGRWPQLGRPQLIPAIANHWLEDEAYLRLLPNKAWADSPQQIALLRDTTAAGAAVVFRQGNLMEEYRAGLQVYEGLKQGQAWYLKRPDGHFISLWPEGPERALFLSTVQDFLRLTEAGG
ncbi:hypothetical protein [Phaeodactylibacter luteus]|uniref:hypothetical protein n=1 Tax=Phaeodactylibacter luteus TaxID=1564516 RepID=UPI001478BE98|nr:hypothetical protein [Phaeodactylibacter luteus]